MENSPALAIRGPNSDDWVSLYALLNLPAVMVNLQELPYGSEDALRERLSGMAPNVHMLIAEAALPSGRKRIVGAAWLDVQAKRRRHVGRLSMVIHPDYHNTKAAKGLVNAVLDLADNWLGLLRIQATIFADDKAVLDLYESAGFVREATLRRYALRLGRMSDGLILARVTTQAVGLQKENR